MKRIALAMILPVITGITANAQFYFRAGAGYAMPAAGQTISGDGTPYNGSTPGVRGYDVKSASFSAGLQGALGIGYMVNKNVGIQLDAAIGIANKQYKYNEDTVAINSVLYRATIENKANYPVIIIPSMVLQTGGNPWNIYCRMGIALPLRTQIKQDQIFTNLPGTGAVSTYDLQFKITNSFSMGYAAAAGFSYNVSDRISVWAELSILSMSAYIRQSQLSAYLVNGHAINLASVGGTTTSNYSKSGISDTDYVNNPTYSQPFSNVALNVGVKINLSDRKSSSAMRRPGQGD